MAPRPWFRMYARLITDPDIEELSFEDQRHFVFVLCLKCDGLIDKEFDDDDKRERAIARRLGLQGEAFTNAKQRLVDSKLIGEDWQPRSWAALQFESDSDDPTGAERQRRFRDRKRNALRNGDVTATEQSRAEQKQSRAETEQIPAVAGLDPDAWTAWTVYRKRIGKPVKPVSIPAAQRKLAAHGTSQAAVVEQSVANGWQGLFALKPNGAAKPAEPVRTWRPEPGDDETAEVRHARY